MKRNFCLILFVGLSAACTKNMHQARIVLLPDTQTYAEKYPYILDSQVAWIVKNAKDIDFVLQQGDLTQNNNDKEWKIVQAAFTRLNNKVPYVLAVGNHDMGSGAGLFADVRNSTLYNQYFPFHTMSALPGFGGSFEQNRMDNAYYLFQKGKMKWLVLTLEFGPRLSVLNWANDVVSRYPDRTVIVNTHSYMYFDSTRQGGADWWRPQAYGVGKDTGSNAVNDGEQIWARLVYKQPNIRWVFSGHILNTGVGNLVSIDQAGLPVYQMLANYQEGVTGSKNGGNGFLRILDMDFKKRTVSVTTWSPYINQYHDQPGHRFVIKNVWFEPK